jgi:hypothetical protein
MHRQKFFITVICKIIHSFSRMLQNLMKFSQAISQVKWLNGEKTNVLKTISVLVLRLLIWIWLGTQPVLFIPVWALCSWLTTRQWELLGRVKWPNWLAVNHEHGAQTNINSTDCVLNHIHMRTLRTRTEMVFEMLVFSPFNHLTQLTAQDNFIILSHWESNRSYNTTELVTEDCWW